ncbi:hypothetical protein MPSEU_000957400 [Mayamaea pseudoterrestris]|nr:hypothetical protein MPSEU_000957400 [Mayamaea pseudoterrestris]
MESSSSLLPEPMSSMQRRRRRQDEHQQQQPILSIAKTLTKLLAVSSNRSCADCRATLVDSSQIHASVSHCDYNLHGNQHAALHESGKPSSSSSHRGKGLPKVPETRHLTLYETNDSCIDPALLASHRVGGHGVFVCSKCAAAHELLGTNCAVVHEVQDVSVWSQAEIVQLIKSGGNARSWQVLEAYLPPSWESKRPNFASSIGDRLVFIRAKYEALAFVLPQPGPKAFEAWTRIVERHPEWRELWGDDATTPADIDMGYGESVVQAVMNPAAVNRELPDRLVDYVCVVACSDYVDPMQATTDLSRTRGPEDILLVPFVRDCYPGQDAHVGLEFPEHVSTFLFPEGCKGSSSALAPSFFTFVLTTANGDRLYGGALRVYDDDRDINYYKEALENSEYKGLLPKWLGENDQLQASQRSNGYSDMVFLPQCLVVLSHYPFFDSWRKFLLQIYLITKIESPLPIERFIANFTREIPLPPPGKIQIRLQIIEMWTIHRPAPNELPLADFSFRPLFTLLSSSNILVVFACLLKEMRVALCSKCYSILCPVAEALTSLLFPFHWEGMYLPIMPYSMLDILDAPVPYIVGLHSRYLSEVKPEHRPRGVVFVDLDSDVVHLGFEDSENRPRDIPCLPERQAAKLKAKLVEFASSVYVQPASLSIGSVTCGSGERPPVSRRPSYVGFTELVPTRTKIRRRELLSQTEKAYRENDLQLPSSGFLTEHGQLYAQEMPANHSQRKTPPSLRPLKRLTRSKSHESLDAVGRDDKSAEVVGLLDLDEPDGFSSQGIREGFLRFFVSLLQNYRTFLKETEFQATCFIQSLCLGESSTEFCDSFVKTQLFHRFIEERRERSDPEVLLFDESINAKINRSKKNALMSFGRPDMKDTAFLDDTSHSVKETYTPPPPSNWGLPDDGRRYSYSKLPALRPNLFGKIRPPMKWHSNLRQSRRASLVQHQAGQAVYYQTMAPMLRSRPHMRSAIKRGSKSLENALGALSNAFDGKPAEITPLPSVSSGPSLLDRSLHSYLMTSAYINQDSSPYADKRKPKRNSEILSSAEKVVVNARRKQSILIGIFATFQMRQKVIRGSLAGDSFESGLETLGLKNLSKTTRMQLSAVDAACSIQSMFRCFCALRNFHGTRFVALCSQSLYRSRRTRWVFMLLREAMIKLQAVVRGYIIRKLLCSLIDGRLIVYRKHIIYLWQRDHTPIAYRTNFWFIVQFNGMLQLGIAEDEICRLWKRFNFQSPSDLNNRNEAQHHADNSLFTLATRLGTKTHVYCLVYRLGVTMQTANADLDQLKRSALRETAERAQVYERLCAITSNDRLMGYFHRFAVSSKAKKKLELSATIWTKYEQADDSTTTMLELFPELQHTTNLILTDMSKKGSRRFRRNSSMSEHFGQLDRSMWAHSFLSNRIHEYVRAVADVSLRLVPTLATRFTSLDKKRSDLAQGASRRRQTILAARNVPLDRWPEYRIHLMRQLLIGQATDLIAPSTYQARKSRAPVNQRRHTMETIPLPQPELKASISRANNFINTSKRASMSGSSHHSFEGGQDPNGSMSFSSFHSATDHLADDENVEVGLESLSFGG